MRVVLVVSLLAALTVTVALAQTSSPIPSMLVTPRVGGQQSAHDVQGQNFPAGSSVPIMLFDPTGNERVLQAQTSSDGAFTVHLAPTSGPWLVGLYRVVAGLSGGRAISGTFTVSDGMPHLFEIPDLPSPTSAFLFSGIDLPPNLKFDVVLQLTGGQQGTRTLHAATDADGVFWIYVWPGQFNFPFFAAGDYSVSIPSLNLTTLFRVREHPVSAEMVVTGPVPPSGIIPIHMQYYAAGRYLWGVYQSSDGQTGGEILVGPTDPRGGYDGILQLGTLRPGHYYLATPYDWGETEFDVPAPTATAVPTVTLTPVPTVTVTPLPTPKPTKTPIKKCPPKGKKPKGCKP